MKKLFWSVMLLVLAGLILAACVQAEPTTLAPQAKIPAVKVSASSPEVGWEQKWQATLAQAKKEGVVSVYSLWGARIRVAISKPFKEKYGIDLEFSLFARADELAAKTAAEQRAGLYLADLFTPGSAGILVSMKPQGLLGPIEPLLILPEVLEPKAWLIGEVPFPDKERTTLYMIGSVMRSVAYNTSLIKEGEITNYKDLLKPQYKGKIILNDPSVTGGSNTTLTHLSNYVWGEEETVNFLSRLVREQEVLILRDHRVHVEWLARGKYAISIAPMRELLAEWAAMGAPIKWAADLKEENHLSTSTGTLAVPSRLPHPNATIVFVNWLLTKEGQSAFAPSFGAPSLRLDASKEGIDPLLIPVPGEKYYLDTEKEMATRARLLEIAKKIIAETTK